MLDIALSNLWNRKLRSFLTVLGIAVCANLFIVVTSITNFITSDLHRQVASFNGQIVVQSRSEFGQRGLEFPPLSSSVSQADAIELQARPDIAPELSTSVLFVGLAAPPFAGGPPAILGVGVDVGHERALQRSAKMSSGRFEFTPDATNEVILGAFAGRALIDSASTTTEVPTPAGKLTVPAVGSTISVRGATLTVVGLIDGYENQLFRSMLVIPLPTAQTLFNRPASVSGAILTPRRDSALTSISAAIEKQYPQLSAVTESRLADTAQVAVAQEKQFMDILRVTALLAAAVIVTIVMLVAVLERTRELGTLRAIGASSASILSMIITESLLLVAAGVATAIPVSVIALRTSFRYGNVLVDRFVWADSAALLIVVGLAASLLPAWRASRIDPAVAIRYE